MSLGSYLASGCAGPWEHGERPKGQGDRSDIRSFLTDAKGLQAGDVKVTDLQDTHASIEARHTRYFDRVVGRYNPVRDFQTFCVVFYGDSGTGKSHYAHKWCRDLGLEVYSLRLPESKRAQLFWDGYAAQPAVIVDEMQPDAMQLREFNALCDCYPHSINIKGQAFVPFVSRLIIFTSNFAPDEWFLSRDGSERLRQTVLRRVHWQLHFTYGDGHRPDRTFSNRDEVWGHSVVAEIKPKSDALGEWLDRVERPLPV